MTRQLLAAILATMLASSPALAITAEEAVADHEFCKAVVIEQIESHRNQQARNDLARVGIEALSAAILGRDVASSATYAGRSAANGALNRQQSNVYQQRAMEQQCRAERMRNR